MFSKLPQLLEKFDSGGGGGNDGKGPKKNRWAWLLALAGVGVMLFILSSFLADPVEEDNPFDTQLNKDKPTTSTVETTVMGSMQDYEKKYETQLAAVLEKVQGISDVTVMVNLDSTEEEVVQYDTREQIQTTTENDTKGGTRSTEQNNTERKTTMHRTDNGDQPVVVKRLKPKVRGVIVVAKGTEDLVVKARVLEAIQRTLDVPLHRISVMPTDQ